MSATASVPPSRTGSEVFLPSTILSRRDLDFLLHEWLDVEALLRREPFAEHNRETIDAVLDLSERLATEYFATHNKKSDAQEPRYDGDRVQLIPEVGAALRAFGDAGLMAAGQKYEWGGMQLPSVVERASFAWFLAANVASAGYPFLTIGAANLLVANGTREQIERFVRPMAQGKFFGTMCLSEPHAGSSLADLRTRAVPQEDGSYRVVGQKMWISGGEHELAENIVHLVLARLPDAPPGVRGLSLFITPKYLVEPDGTIGERNDIDLIGLNHKMGQRGITNCLLGFGGGRFRPRGRQGAVGYLVGEPHGGLACMFHMMNEARIGVGLAAAALGYTGYLHALSYARSRPQGRHRSTRDPLSPQVPIVEHADVRRMLLMQKAYVEGALALNLYCARLVDESHSADEASARTRAGLLLDVLTPIAKSWSSQWCLEANSLAIQVHGGSGYTRDCNVEQFYRDNRLNPIHEGTHGMQGIDLLGRKMAMLEGAGLELLVDTIVASARRALLVPALAEYAKTLTAVTSDLAAVTRKLHDQPEQDRMLANASVYLEAAGHVVVAWIWLEQALAAAGKSGAFYDGKRQAAAYFFGWELPKVQAQLDLLARRDMTCFDMQDEWF